MRRNKSIALILSAAILFTSNAFAAFADTYETNDYAIDAEQVEEISADESSEVSQSADEWKVENLDESSSSVNIYQKSDANGNTITQADITPKKFDTMYEETPWGGYKEGDAAISVNLCFRGTTSSRDISISSDELLAFKYLGENEDEKKVNIKTDNHVVRRVEKGKNIGPVTLEINKKQIEEKVLEIECGEGVHVEEVKTSSEENYKYRFYVEYNWAVSHNKPALSVSMQAGEYTISYPTCIPFFGKGKESLNEIKESIIITDKQGYEYKPAKMKVVRLKSAPANQGPFPTVSNAAIQITKLTSEKADKKSCKQAAKAIKKASKVNKKASYESQLLPVVIYPYRLGAKEVKNEDDLKVVARLTINKSGKMVLEFSPENSKKIKIKNGKKDSFKTGVHEMEYDENNHIFKINSADVWAGPDGIQAYTYSETKSKDKRTVPTKNGKGTQIKKVQLVSGNYVKVIKK